MILQLIGIFFLPMIYYFLAILLQTKTLYTVGITDTTHVRISTSRECWDNIPGPVHLVSAESMLLLPVSLSYYLLAITAIGLISSLH